MIKKQTFNFITSPIARLICLGGLAMTVHSCGLLQTGISSQGLQENVAQVEAAQAVKDLFHMNLDEQGTALRGYDPVSYFTGDAPTKGQNEYSLTWNNATWHFATAENRDLFSQDPDKYAPANGGYCTFGIVLRKKFDGDPQVWSVIKSRLYVFLNEEVQQKFLQDSTGNLQKVSANWPIIQFESPEEL